MNRLKIACVLACLLLPTGAALADLFESYSYSGSFEMPDDTYFYDTSADGRLVALNGTSIIVETAVGSRQFSTVGELPGASYGAYGPSFIRVSPDGSKIAIGDGGGRVGIFNSETLEGKWFSAEHYDAEWVGNDRLGISYGSFGSPSKVSVLDANSADAKNPTNPVVVNNIGGASGGITFDANGRLYTGNGYRIQGPSKTGEIHAFESTDWNDAYNSGNPLDFEKTGTLVLDVLSASSLGFDRDGNLHVGGGDFYDEGVDVDFVGLARASAIANALAGNGPVQNEDDSQLRRFDPDTNYDLNFYSVNNNPVTGELYVNYGNTIFVYVPEPSAIALLVVAAVAGLRRR
jgi:hypothetical protein